MILWLNELTLWIEFVDIITALEFNMHIVLNPPFSTLLCIRLCETKVGAQSLFKNIITGDYLYLARKCCVTPSNQRTLIPCGYLTGHLIPLFLPLPLFFAGGLINPPKTYRTRDDFWFVGLKTFGTFIKSWLVVTNKQCPNLSTNDFNLQWINFVYHNFKH